MTNAKATEARKLAAAARKSERQAQNDAYATSECLAGYNPNAGFDVIIAKMAEMELGETMKLAGIDAATRTRGSIMHRTNKLFVEGALDAMDFETFRSFAEYRLDKLR